MNTLPPAAAGLLEQARQADRAEAVDLERTLSALHGALPFADVAAGAPLDVGAGPAVPASSTTLGGVLATKTAKLLLVTLALGGGLGGTLLLRSAPRTERAVVQPRASLPTPASSDQRSTPAIVADDAPRAAVRASAETGPFGPSSDSLHLQAPLGADATRLPAAEAVSAQIPVARGEPARTSAHPSEAPKRATTAARERTPLAPAEPTRAPVTESELDLIDGAFAELRADEPERALALLERHRSLYPTGTFVTERHGLNVLALCAAGRLEEGRSEQAKFLRRAPNSPIAARVRNACAAEKGRP